MPPRPALLALPGQVFSALLHVEEWNRQAGVIVGLARVDHGQDRRRDILIRQAKPIAVIIMHLVPSTPDRPANEAGGGAFQRRAKPRLVLVTTS